jgi:hypothetical protein
LYYPQGIAVDETGNVYVADTYNHRIQKYNSSGAYLAQWGSRGSGNRQFLYPIGIDVDKSGNVYVVDCNNHRIQKFGSSGMYITQWGSLGSGEGQFNFPWDISVDSSGNIYIADSRNHRIQKFNSTGTFLTQWGSFGSDDGQFYFPESIAVNATGNIYVADRNNNRIQEFSSGLPSPDATTGLALNGSFEVSPALSEWTTGGALPVTRAAHASQESYSLQLGQSVPNSPQGEGQAWAFTSLYVHPEWTRPVLTFQYNLFVNDIFDYSDFFVAVQDGVGLNHLATVLRDGFRACNNPGIPPSAGRDLGWRSVSYDLSAFKGRHIRIVFSNRNLWPDSWGIWSYVDNVRVLDAGALPSPAGAQRIYVPMTTLGRCDVVASSDVLSDEFAQALFLK